MPTAYVSHDSPNSVFSRVDGLNNTIPGNIDPSEDSELIEAKRIIQTTNYKFVTQDMISKWNSIADDLNWKVGV